MAKYAEKYKEPKIVRAKRGWFIALWYRWPESWPNKSGTHKRFEISAGVNYIHDLTERENEIQTLLRELKRLLQKGFDPFMENAEESFVAEIEEKKAEIAEIERAELAEKEQTEEEESRWTLQKGFKAYLEDCSFRNMKPTSLNRYRSYVNNIRNWLNDNEWLDAVASDFTDADVKRFLYETSEQKKWKPRTYNNHIDFLPTLFGQMEKLEKLANGPHVIYALGQTGQDKKLDRSEKYRAYFGPVAHAVKEKLSEFPYLESYVKWIYLSCMRPSEIRLLQVKDIDLRHRQIKIAGEDGKTGDRFVPVSDELMELIVSMGLEKRPFNHFVFGFMGTDMSRMVGQTYFADQYRLKVRIPLGLDDKYTPYGWKHTRVIELIYAGFTDYEIMSLTGHDDYESFQLYKRELMVNTKAMQGKTVSF